MEAFRNKIEQYGVMMEQMGLTPVAARVYVYLLLCREPGATFEDLVSFFKVSKSAVSNALKMLQASNMAGYKTVGGQRKRYFFVDFGSMFDEKNMTAKFALVAGMLKDIQQIRGVDDAFGRELEHASLLYKMLLVEFPIIFERWKRLAEYNEKEQ